MASRPLRIAASATSTLALVAAGIAATTSASQAAPGVVDTTLCPGENVWVGDLTPGQHVTGKTTTQGTTIDEFEGEYVSTDEDPFGNDILVFKLSGSRITKADGTVDAGIWAGISGSPVYDDSHNLIGSVSYGFTDIDRSEWAGITPAKNIIETDTDITPTAAAAAKKPFAISSDVKKDVSKAGTRLPAGSKWKPVSLQRVTVGDAASASRLASKSRELGQYTGSSKATLGTASLADTDIDSIEPGGNIATSWSYGDIPLAAVGTVTAVCEYATGDKVYAFGHPDENRGDSTQTFLSASATKIIANGGFSYKTAVIEKTPEGPLIQDGLNGVVGVLGGPIPHATEITTEVAGRFPQSQSTSVTTPEALASAVAIQINNAVVNATKNQGPGEVTLAWTIGYTPEVGAPATYARSQRISSTSYNGEEVAYEIASDVEFLQAGSDQRVVIDSVDIDATVTNTYKALRVSKVEYRKSGTWRTAKPGEKITAKRGTTLPVRVTLGRASTRSAATPVTLRLDQTINKYATGTGRLSIGGGSGYYYDDEEFTIDLEEGEEEFYYDDTPLTLPQVLAALKSQTRYDSVNTTQDYKLPRGTAKTWKRSASVPSVTSGLFALRLTYKK